LRERARSFALVAILWAVGLASRIAAARGMAFWADDLGTIWAAKALSLEHPFAPIPAEWHPPLSFLLARVWFALAGLTGSPGEELAARLPFIVIGSAAVPLAWLVARKLLERESSALAVAAATAVSPLLVWCDRDLRSYALLTPVVLATVLAWMRAQDEDRLRDWAAFVLLGALALWTHYSAIPLVAALLLGALVARVRNAGSGSKLRPVIAGACILVLFAPWLPAFWSHLTTTDLEAHRARVQLAVPPVALTAPAYVLFGLVLGYSVFPWNFAVVIPTAAAAVVLAGQALVRARERASFRPVMLGLVLPIATVEATTFKMPRYYVAFVPLLAAVLVSGLERLSSRSRRAAIVAGALLAAGVLASDVELFRGREGHFLYPLHPWPLVRARVQTREAPIFARWQSPFGSLYSPAPVRDPSGLLGPDAPAEAWVLLDEATTREEESTLLAGLAARGYAIVSDETLLRDEDHDARERWVPRGKRAEAVRLLFVRR
jgi:hypothetical protein